MKQSVLISIEPDECGNEWKTVRIDGVLNSIFATCRHCDVVVKAVSPARTREYLRDHDCIAEFRYKKFMQKAAITIREFI